MPSLLTILLVLLSLTLAGLLWFERSRQRRELARLQHAISQQDRRLLGSEDYAKAPSHIRSLERAIFDQLFTTANLEESVTRREKLLSALVDGLGDAVLVTDKANRIRLANERATTLLKLPANSTGAEVRHVVSNQQLLTWLESCQRNGTAVSSVLTLPGRTLGSGKEGTFEVDIAPLQTNELGGADVSRIVLHDISELQELERVRKDFVANASHELRTPLTIINGYLENLIDDDAISEPETAKRFLTVMQKHGQRLARIVEDMLTISRLESDSRESIKIKGFDFRRCVQEVADRLSPIIEAKSANVVIDVPTGEETFQGDQFYWDQILFNLMENALKENDRPGLTLTVSKRNSSSKSTIVINDDGIGIPKDALPFIFKRFYRVDESHNSEKTGTGLGLSIVKRAVEAHHGVIKVSSTPGMATTFTITIPHQPVT